MATAEGAVPDERQGQGGSGDEKDVTNNVNEANPSAPLSKNQMKKQAKLQRMQEVKLRRKAEEKEAKEAQRAAKAAARQAELAALPEEERKRVEEERAARKLALLNEQRKEKDAKKERMLKAMSGCGQKVVIDLDFDGRMAEKDVRSLAQQLTYCYSSNIKAAQPCHLHLLGAAGTLKELVQRNCAGLSNWHATVSEAPYHEHFKNARDRLVYLTADSDHELEALDPDAIYVIGGIVDRNKFKGLCYDRAREHGVATARLPIKKYVQLGSSAVLTVNHVLQILVEWLQHRDWRRAFESTIPERKRAGYVKGGGGSGGSGAGESVGDEGARRSSEGGSRGNGEGEEDEDGSPPSPASWPEVGQGAEGGSGGATAAVATAGDGNADAGGPAVKRARTENGGDGASDKPPSDAT